MKALKNYTLPDEITKATQDIMFNMTGIINSAVCYI